MADNKKNFSYSKIATAPDPSTTGLSLTVETGDGALFPTPPFNVTIWPDLVQPLFMNAEIVRVTDITGDVLTITREQESTTAKEIATGYQIASTITKNTFDDYIPYTGATSNVNIGAYNITVTSAIETTPTLLKLDQTTSQTITNGQPIQNTLTALELVATAADKKLQSLTVSTYPSLVELSYIKGTTSAIQTQLGTKAPLTSPVFVTNITTPLLVGGTAVGDKITYKSTTGVGTTTGIAHQFTGGTDGATVIATMLNNGNVGIGTTVPGSFKLSVNGNMNIIGASSIYYIDGGTSWTNNGMTFYSGSGTTIKNYNNGALNLGTNNTTRVTIDNTGNVGIGTTDPQKKLDVNGDTRIYNQTPTTGLTKFSVRTGAGNSMAGSDDQKWITEVLDNSGSRISGVRMDGLTASKIFSTQDVTTAAIAQVGTGYSNGLNLYNLGQVAWSSTGDWFEVKDIGLSRGAAGKIYIGNGTQGDYSGTLVAGSIGIGTTGPTAVLHLKAGTATAGTAPLKFTSQATGLTTPEAGAMELIGNSLQFTQLARRRGIVMSRNTITTTTTVANTTVESAALVTSSFGANYLEVGKREELELDGIIAQRSNPAAILTIRVKYAGVTKLTITTPASTVISARQFSLHVRTTVRTTGATGTLQMNAMLDVNGITLDPSASALATIDTTAAQDMTVTFQWGEADVANTISVEQGRVLTIEPNR